MKAVVTDISEILLGLQTLLVDANIGLNTSTCIIAMPEKPIPQMPSSAQFVVIRPGKQDVDQGYVTGGGTDCMYFRGDFLVQVYSQSNLDNQPSDESWLTDGTTGAWPLTQSVITTLQMAVLKDGNGNVYTPEAIKMTGITKFSRDQKIQGYGFIETKWLIGWALQLGA